MTYLINDTYLTKYTSVSTNKNEKPIIAAFHAVTVAYLKPLLGIKLYELFEDHVENNTSLNDIQTELFNHVQYFMAIRVERYMMFNVLKINNLGVQKTDNTADMDTIKLLRQEAESLCDTAKKIVLNYLNDNKNDFPEFYPETESLTTVANHADNSSGIVFDEPYIKYYQ